MGTGLRLLLLSLAAALAGAVVIDAAYGWYGQRHFVPQMLLRTAESQGDGCVLTLGDSRIAAGIDPSAMAETLQAEGVPRHVANLGIGAVGINGAAMALRQFVADGTRPAVVVLGESPGTLLPEATGADPNELVGNRAIELQWSKASDVEIYYPGFPFAELDRGVRFLAGRANALESYKSLTWIKVQGLQGRLVGSSSEEPHNRFGSLSDMRSLLSGFRTTALGALGRFDGRWEHSPWFTMLRRIAHDNGARLVVIEVPMRSTYRDDVLATPQAGRYRQWLQADLAKEGDAFLDCSSPASITDADFEDGLHLGADGARRFSSELGHRLAPIFSAERPSSPPR